MSAASVVNTVQQGANGPRLPSAIAEAILAKEYLVVVTECTFDLRRDPEPLSARADALSISTTPSGALSSVILHDAIGWLQ